jgi:DNA-binding response OmpR family regulator
MKKHVIIIDDDEDMLFIVSTVLFNSGYEVRVSTDPDLINTFKKGFPDLLLLDVHLAGKNGGDICKYLKNHKETAEIPVILFSSIPDLEKFSKEKEANDYVSKPFDIEELKSKIDRQLNAA